MTPLRQRFLDELTRRNYSPRTLEAYLAALIRFSRHFQRSPDQLGQDHIRSFQLHLIQHDQVSWSAFNQIVCALRFFYRHVLQQPDLVPFIPYGKKPKTLPVILSVAQVLALLEAFGHPPTRMLFRTIYACGLRISEAIALQVKDVDSARRLVHVRQGKGRKDRLVPLSPLLLQELRCYWQRYRPQTLLFPGQTAAGTLCAATLQKHCTRATQRAGLSVRVTPHTLRHCYATHLLEAGVDLATLQRLLGHNQLSTTLRYLHLRSEHLARLPGLLEGLPTRSDEPGHDSSNPFAVG
jgi:integrase/recombinase XerD